MDHLCEILIADKGFLSLQNVKMILSILSKKIDHYDKVVHKICQVVPT